MAGELSRAFARFDAMSPEERRGLDDALSFMVTASGPTEAGARNRGYLQEHPITEDQARLIGAYKAYKFKAQYKPMDPQKVALLKLNNVPQKEIDRIGGQDHWEQQQIDFFKPLLDETQPTSADMPAEEFTAAPKKKAKGRPARKAEGAAPSAAPSAAPVAAPSPAPPLEQPAGEPRMPLYAAPPEDERMPIGAMLGGSYV